MIKVRYCVSLRCHTNLALNWPKSWNSESNNESHRTWLWLEPRPTNAPCFTYKHRTYTLPPSNTYIHWTCKNSTAPLDRKRYPHPKVDCLKLELQVPGMELKVGKLTWLTTESYCFSELIFWIKGPEIWYYKNQKKEKQREKPTLSTRKFWAQGMKLRPSHCRCRWCGRRRCSRLTTRSSSVFLNASVPHHTTPESYWYYRLWKSCWYWDQQLLLLKNMAKSTF